MARNESMLHNGEPIPSDMEFFGEPADIGPLISAYSTLRTNHQPTSLTNRLVLSVVSGLGVLLLGILLSKVLENQPRTQVPESLASAMVLLGIGLGTWATIYVFNRTNFPHVCTFVGKKGIAQSKIKASRENIYYRDKLLFADAADLFAVTTDNQVNGVYAGTKFDFTWRDKAGGIAYRFKGSFNRPRFEKDPKCPYHYAMAAEKAWSAHLLEQLKDQIKLNGYAEFKVRRKDRIRVGPGFLELAFGGQVQRVRVDEIAKMTIENGYFQIKHKDAKWWSGKGKFVFNYGAMSNARVFLLVIKHFCGIRFPG